MERFIFVAVLALVVLFDGSAVSAVGPLKTCNRDDGNLNECLKDAFQSAMTSLAGGFSEGDVHFPALDPYKKDEIKFAYDQHQVSVAATVKNITCHGLSSSKIRRVRANLQDDSMDLEVDVSNKRLFVTGSYVIEGSFNALKVMSYGDFDNAMKNMTWTWKIKGKPFAKNGKTFMNVTAFAMRPEMEDMDVNMPHLIRGNKVLNDYFVTFLKTQWRIVYQEMLPTIERIWSEQCTKLANVIFHNIAYDEIFPSEF